jgi:hypothetical protein
MEVCIMAAVDSTSPLTAATCDNLVEMVEGVTCAVDRVEGVLSLTLGGFLAGQHRDVERALFALEVLVRDTKARVGALSEAVQLGRVPSTEG